VSLAGILSIVRKPLVRRGARALLHGVPTYDEKVIDF